MSITESVRGRFDSYRIAYWASYERTLGKSVWDKIEERRLCFPPEDQEGLNMLLDLSLESDPNEWHQKVGEVAKDCPREMPKDLRLRWVLRELSRREKE